MFSAFDTVSADSSVIYVNDSGGNDLWNGEASVWDGLTLLGPKKSIKNATGTVSEGGTVNIADGTYTGADNTNIVIDKNITIAGQSRENTIINGTDSSQIFSIQSGKTVKIQNLTLANGNSTYGGAIFNRGNLTMNGTSFIYNTATYYGGAIAGDGTLSIADSTFLNNTANQEGGALFNIGNLTVNNSNFTNNSADNGGAISNEDSGNLTIQNSYFNNNKAANGGAILNYNNLTVANSNFTSNTVTSYGGAIASSGNSTVFGSDFTNNTANYGGAIHNYQDNLIVENSSFNNNKASNGGAIFNNGGLNVANSDFTGNNVTSYGGAVASDGALSIVNSKFVDNIANQEGGALSNNGNCTVNSSNFTGNSAGNGGAISNYYSSNLTVKNSDFNDNKAGNGGAIINYNNLTVIGSDFISNSATSYGGAIASSGNSTVTSITFTNNTANYGGAINNYGNFTVNFSRIAGNTANQGKDIFNSGGTINATNNWWGSNAGPSTGSVVGTTVNSWMVLTVNATPTNISSGKTSTITADLLHDNHGNYHDPANGTVPDGINASFKINLGSVNPESVLTSKGIATTIFTSENPGLATVSATVDSQTVNTQTTIGRNDVYVSTTGSDTDGDGSQSNPFKTIKTGILNVYSGGILNIADGTYTGENNINVLIDKDMTIIGQSKDGTIINGTNSSQIFMIQSGINVIIQNLTIVNGNATSGGAIYNQGNLTVNDSTFSNNIAYVGGAISNYGALTVENSFFTNNTAYDWGGAIYNENSSYLDIKSSIFTLNYADIGGSIFNRYNLIINGSNFLNNTATSASVIYNTGNLTVNGSTIMDNTAIVGGGAISNLGIITVNGSTFTNNNGGAISNSGNLTVNNSFFNANAVYHGGAINNDGNLTVNGSFFYANFADDGSAIYNTGNLTAHFNIIAGNIVTPGISYEIYNSGSTVDLNNNWWGYNSGPITSSIFDLSHLINLTTWLVLKVTASPNIISSITTSTITADLTHDNNGVYHDPAIEHVLDGISVYFITDLGNIDDQSFMVNGTAQTILNGGNVEGTANVSAGIAYLYASTLVAIDTTPPTVNSVDPVNNSKTNVNNKVITVTFDEPIQKGSAYDSISVTGHSGAISMTKEINGNTLTLTHGSSYNDGDYNVNIPVNAVMDLASNDLAVAFTSSFTVDTIAPIVTANSTGGLFNNSQRVLLTANDNLDPSPVINYTTDGKNWYQFIGSGTVLISNEGTTNLEFYAADDLGNPSAHTIYTYTIDKTKPTVTANHPSGTYNTIKTVTLSATDNLDLSPVIYYSVNNGVTWKSQAKTITLNLNHGKTVLMFYAKDKAGNNCTIHTVTYNINTIAPKVISTSPKNGATGVSRTSTISIKFSENIKASSYWSKIYIKNLTTGKLVSISKSISGNTLNIKMSSKRYAYNGYQVYIPKSAVKDNAGNNLTTVYKLNFKTGRY